jgi:hypothetical protein
MPKCVLQVGQAIHSSTQQQGNADFSRRVAVGDKLVLAGPPPKERRNLSQSCEQLTTC